MTFLLINQVVFVNDIQVHSKIGSFLIELMTIEVSKTEEEPNIDVLNRLFLFLAPYEVKLLKLYYNTKLRSIKKQYGSISDDKITEIQEFLCLIPVPF